MFKDLERLVDVQKIDIKLLEINNLKGDLPQVVENLQNHINTLTKELDNERKREKEILLEIKNLEAKIADDKIRLNRYQDQLYLVTSNKEYDALTSEIDTLKQEIDSAEYNILKLTDESDQLKVSIKGKSLTLEEKIQERDKKQSVLDKTDITTKDAQAALMEQRNSIVDLIPIRYMREYERIAKAKNGIAIVPILQIFEEKVDKKGNVEYIPMQVSCGGCSKIVPPQKIVEIRNGDRINRCEFCGRILYWDVQSSEIRSNYEEELF
ncbi:MAG: C4-type zinc ribbon domain-containing protein [Candidatus Marinimicrobia bacterium]|jgi:hypothetical protein|nr:C4-type zinc ribbon domain-containing protein [Candidatus Neomarinimicrobiota bacterium]MCK9484226.1 C4-type zinc ribbon domain-containing protein [Candidatus Neomarinimicrobiota bacterium]MCK9560802.1 C4-type zinc ribbon domain-containing protein [Candidatus Neomarinimicrobiota bacterium]MDD5062114.1 C4-type zinc ribbon domain-containing protein [Candidatus Neomarinimicrobiota bacterium]MDD5540254.1 C4-type zinc ribbon domain-containing protein [Candidatus Neomarinimicrobiota bacterium]